MEKGRLIRLNDNWVSIAVDNLDSFSNVGDYDFRFLDKVLPHCTKEQLVHIENCTKGVDLSPITNKLWKNFFQRDFGGRATDEMMQTIKIKKGGVKWSELYHTKSKSLEKDEKHVGEKLKKMYEKDDARKQSRQVRVLDKVPPSSSNNKRIGFNNKGRKNNKMINKLKKQYQNSLEKKNIDFVKMTRTAAAKFSDHVKPRTTIQAMDVEL